MTPRAIYRPICAQAVLFATTVALTGAAAGPPAAGPPAEPSIRLVQAASSIELRRDALPTMPGWFPLDLGTRVLAEDGAFELRVRRGSYDEAITVTQVGRSGRLTELPADLVQRFRGLPGFFEIEVTAPDGENVLDLTEDFCPNSKAAVRAHPDAPATSHYPFTCSTNPFSLGNVWGIEHGWAAPAVSMHGAPLVSIPAGSYRATVTVAERYRVLWRIPAEQATATVAVTVVDGARGPVARSRRPVPHSQSAGQVAGHAHQHGQEDAEPVRQGQGGHLVDPRLNGRRQRPVGVAAVPSRGRPDLRAVPAFGIGVKTDRPTGRDHLTFAAALWNAGPAPLVVDGFRRAGQDVMDVFQYFYDRDGRQLGHTPAGTMVWDDRDGHSHWHLNRFAAYRLLRADLAEAAISGKEGFCLANTDPVDHFVRGANWQPDNTDLRTACGNYGSLSSRQALHAGFGDTYVQRLPGQSFDITDLPNGTYYVQIEANASNQVYETNRRNNTSLRRVELGGVAGARTVTVPPVGLVP